MRQVSHKSFDAWATLRRRGGHKLAVALDMLDMVRSDGVRRADLQRAARLASGLALADEQVRRLQVSCFHALCYASEWFHAPALLAGGRPSSRFSSMGMWRASCSCIIPWPAGSLTAMRVLLSFPSAKYFYRSSCMHSMSAFLLMSRSSRCRTLLQSIAVQRLNYLV